MKIITFAEFEYRRLQKEKQKYLRIAEAIMKADRKDKK